MTRQASGLPSPRLSVDSDGLARLVFDAPDRSANVLTEEVMRRLADALDELEEGAAKGEVKGVLVSSAKSSFIVGADIDAIAELESPDEGETAARVGQGIYLRLERLPVPTVAAIHGTCVGGGAELALACRYRVASDDASTQLGFPEVLLGILPAWGGTTRLPRLIGLRPALDLLLTGKSIDARKARRIGLVEAVLPSRDFVEGAAAFLRERIEEGAVPTGARRGFAARLMEDTVPGRRLLLTAAGRKVRERTGGHYPAPLKILEVLGASGGRPVEAAFQIEAAAAGELLASPVSGNLIHVFRLREAARKGTGVAGPAEPAEVSKLGVVGAGVMGGGIAQLAAFHGIRVRLRDLEHEAVAHALRHADGLFRSAVEKRKMSRVDARRAMDLISGGVDAAGFGPMDLVVEAVVEKLAVKQQVLKELEERVSERCVLATNTSSLSVDAMAEALERPGRFLGMHFFNPVHKMPLVEVVRGGRTEEWAVATVYALALKLGKVPVVVRDGPGFLVNRILGPYLNEAGYLLEDGATVEEVDRAALDFGMPMGPLRLIDEVGIDVMRHAGETLHQAFGERLAPAPPLVALGETGRLGRKGGLGFYRYERGRESGVDEEVHSLLELGSGEKGNGPPPDEIRDRLIGVMINEAARILSDDVAGSAGDVDLAMIMGTGFPPFRGGLLRLADEIHPRVLVERLERHERAVGPRFSPAPLLTRLAQEDRGFYDAFGSDSS